MDPILIVLAYLNYLVKIRHSKMERPGPHRNKSWGVRPMQPPGSATYVYSYSPHPLYIGMLSPTVFCCCFYAYFT